MFTKLSAGLAHPQLLLNILGSFARQPTYPRISHLGYRKQSKFRVDRCY